MRVYLRAQGAAEAPPSPFEETLRRLGRLHEARDLAALAATTDVVDLSPVDDRRERERETFRLLSEGAEAIYQGHLRALVDVEVELDGEACESVGEPDFLIRTAAGHRIRDSKLARRIEGPVAAEVQEYLDYHGQNLRTRFRFLDTWLRTPAGWRLVARHNAAVLKDPPGISLSRAELCAYAGEYQLTPAITTTVRCTEKGLIAERSDRPPATYLPEVRDVFFVAGRPRTRRIFTRDSARAVVGFVDRREGEDVRWKKIR